MSEAKAQREAVALAVFGKLLIATVRLLNALPPVVRRRLGRRRPRGRTKHGSARQGGIGIMGQRGPCYAEKILDARVERTGS